MKPLDPDIGHATALVIDSHGSSRSALVAMLRAAGVGSVEQVSGLVDARRALESRRFDIVLCEYHFDGDSGTGQDLLADLRLAQLLPLDTVVVMISGESAYDHVAEAAEVALDAYLIKPHTEQALHDRLADARQRKRALKPILDCVAAHRYAEAAEACRMRLEVRGPAWVHAARIGAELFVRLGQPHAAQRMLEAVLSTKALPWVRMGIARAQYRAGSLAEARRTLESLLGEQPGYADAYDVMGRVLLEQGDSQAALQTLRQASRLTPGSVARLQKFGVLAFYHGLASEAADALARATAMGLNSRVFDLQGLVLQAALQYDARDRRALARTQATIMRQRIAHPDDARIARLADVVTVLHWLLERRVPEGVRLCQQMLASVGEPDFDFESACNLMIVIARIYADESHLGDIAHGMHRLAQRFAVSKAATEMLVCAGRQIPALAQPLRAGHACISAIAEQAIERSLGGQRREAVLDLLTQAETTLNAKLLHLADNTLQRHAGAVPDAASLRQRIDALRASHNRCGTQIQLTMPGEERA